MGYSVSDSSKVGFSKGAKVYIGAVGALKGACVEVGLLGADATLSMEKTFRTKNDYFPEVEVASAVQALTMTGNIVLREWTKQNLMYALDVASGDVTDVTATPVSVVDEIYAVPAAGALSVVIPRVGLTNIVVKEGASTTHVLDTDYTVGVTATQTVITAITGGGIVASDELKISYDYTPLAHTEMPLGHSGARNYYGVWFEEENTTSSTAKTEYQIFRAAIGLDGSFNFNNAESGVDLPIVIQAALQPGQTALGKLYHYE